MAHASGADGQRLAPDAGAAGAAADTKPLQELWASAYEAWVGPEGAGPEEVVYMQPAGGAGPASLAEDACAAPWPAWVAKTRALAAAGDGLFGLTAFNPMGEDKPHAENLRQNLLLQRDIEELCRETGGTWWRSFGFAEDWHEKGFTVAAPRDRVVELAKKYKQGAVYRFAARGSGEEEDAARCGAPFLRQTVPALLGDTEADVPVEPTPRPDLGRADPDWKPSE